MEEHREEYKEAAMEDCLALNGVEKAGACSCAVEQTNYPVIFKFLAKHNLIFVCFYSYEITAT